MQKNGRVGLGKKEIDKDLSSIEIVQDYILKICCNFRLSIGMKHLDREVVYYQPKSDYMLKYSLWYNER